MSLYTYIKNKVEAIRLFFLTLNLLYDSFKKNNTAAGGGGAKTIIMFLVVVLIFTGVFGTIAMNLDDLGANANVAAIPGGTVMVSIVGLLGIIIIVMWAIKKAF